MADHFLAEKPGQMSCKPWIKRLIKIIDREYHRRFPVHRQGKHKKHIQGSLTSIIPREIGILF